MFYRMFGFLVGNYFVIKFITQKQQQKLNWNNVKFWVKLNIWLYPKQLFSHCQWAKKKLFAQLWLQLLISCLFLVLSLGVDMLSKERWLLFSLWNLLLFTRKKTDYADSCLSQECSMSLPLAYNAPKMCVKCLWPAVSYRDCKIGILKKRLQLLKNQVRTRMIYPSLSQVIFPF